MELSALLSFSRLSLSRSLEAVEGRLTGWMEVGGLLFEVACWDKMLKKRWKSGIPATAVSLTLNYVRANFVMVIPLGPSVETCAVSPVSHTQD